jgi:hypothetical protein
MAEQVYSLQQCSESIISYEIKFKPNDANWYSTLKERMQCDKVILRNEILKWRGPSGSGHYKILMFRITKMSMTEEQIKNYIRAIISYEIDTETNKLLIEKDEVICMISEKDNVTIICIAEFHRD